MGNNLKISDLPITSRIDDDALVVLVQDHSNKVVTVSELSDKINERQNHTIDHLWHEMKRLTNAETVKAMSNALANHEYRIDGIEKLNGKQDGQLVQLTKSMQDLAAKSFAHDGDIRLLRIANIENRRSLAYLNCRVDAQIEKADSYFNTISTIEKNLADLSEKHEADLAYTYQYIEDARQSAVDSAYSYTSYEVDNAWSYINSAYAYINDTLNTYLHRSTQEYWGVVDEMDDLFTAFDDNRTPESTKKDDNTSTTGTCVPGCGC